MAAVINAEIKLSGSGSVSDAASELELAELSEHHDDSTGRTRRYCCERSELGWIFVAFALVKFWCRAGRRNAERVHANDFLSVRVIDKRLRLSAPTQDVPHRRCRGNHRARSIHGVATLHKDFRTRRGSERFACDCDPVLSMQRWLCRLRVGGCTN